MEGKTICAQGDVADTVFHIQKGQVEVVVVSEQGKEAVVGILEPGQFFGEGCMNGHSLRIATTTTMEESLITAITKTAVLATLHNEPKFSELFMTYLLTRNSRIEEDLIYNGKIEVNSSLLSAVLYDKPDQERTLNDQQLAQPV